MKIKSKLSPNSPVEDIPVSILVLARIGRDPYIITSEPQHPAKISGHTFVHLPETFQALVNLARITFHLHENIQLRITTDNLDVCHNAPVHITEDVYGSLRDVLDYLRVEVQ
ncbi:hypothetical protein BD779DRAFT_1672694 [Infundibulicybe gibba]|nr:hypothetical protein BD779DRAFT_1672694 [Infundibulicybe gibba]